MSVTFTNDVNIVVDGLLTLFRAEFPVIDVHFADDYDPSRIGQGEYLRVWIEDTDESATFALGETRAYNCSATFYFNDVSEEDEASFELLSANRTERLKYMLLNNRSYMPSSVYNWHNIDNVNIVPLSELEAGTAETETYIKMAEVTFTVSRSNFV